MTRHDDRYYVAGHVIGDRAHRTRFSNLLGEPRVRPHFAARNSRQRLHHFHLELGRLVEIEERFVDAFAAQRVRHLTSQRVVQLSALEVAAVSLHVTLREIVERSAAMNHPQSAIAERDPDIVDLIDVIDAIGAARFAQRARRGDGE